MRGCALWKAARNLAHEPFPFKEFPSCQRSLSRATPLSHNFCSSLICTCSKAAQCATEDHEPHPVPVRSTRTGEGRTGAERDTALSCNRNRTHVIERCG